jgi:hypothetical protein
MRVFRVLSFLIAQFSPNLEYVNKLFMKLPDITFHKNSLCSSGLSDANNCDESKGALLQLSLRTPNGARSQQGFARPAVRLHIANFQFVSCMNPSSNPPHLVEPEGSYTRLPLSFILSLIGTTYASYPSTNFLKTHFNIATCWGVGVDRLCGLVVRVPGCGSRGPGLDSRRYQIF